MISLIGSGNWQHSMEFTVTSLITLNDNVLYINVGNENNFDIQKTDYLYRQQKEWDVYNIEWNLTKIPIKGKHVIIDNLYNWCATLASQYADNSALMERVVRQQLLMLTKQGALSLVIFSRTCKVRHFKNHFVEENSRIQIENLYLQAVEFLKSSLPNTAFFMFDVEGYLLVD